MGYDPGYDEIQPHCPRSHLETSGDRPCIRSQEYSNEARLRLRKISGTPIDCLGMSFHIIPKKRKKRIFAWASALVTISPDNFVRLAPKKMRLLAIIV